MRIKIVGDGTVNGTSIVDADTGEPVEKVTRVEFVHEVLGVPRAVITVICPEVEMVAETAE